MDNKLRYTLEEEKYTNRKVMFNIISEIILLTVIQGSVIICSIHREKSESYYVTVIETITYVPDNCNILILFQFDNMVFMVKERYSHVKRRLSNRINGTVSGPIYLNKGNGRSSQTDKAIDQINITRSFVSSVGNTKGILKQTDIHCELYDITCRISKTYGIPILATFLCCVYEALINLNEMIQHWSWHLWCSS